MRKLDQKFGDTVTVIGVHSGKFTRERDTSRIRDAAIRLGNTHPIVNDRQFRTWRSYAVNAWPTIVVVGPEGHVLGVHAGEFEAEQLAPFIEGLVRESESRGSLVRGERHFDADMPVQLPGVLRYPGKIAIDGNRIAIADTGHDRLLIGSLDESRRRARIDRIIGGTAGFVDGPGGLLAAPQGVVFGGETLYVADAGNHAVRAVDLETGSVRTVAGTGRQLRTRADAAGGALSSPWDLALHEGTLYIALAGVHRIVALDIASGGLRPFCGSGREEIIDGLHADAALAQPMGLATDGRRLYFADAETSAVRWADLDPAGSVGTLVGTGLFDFGDRDGTGDDARLQHPQAIALHGDGRVLVADSYNDSLKWIDPRTRSCETFVRGLHEPGGLARSAGTVYVADTNAHRIVAVDEENGDLAVLEVEVDPGMG